MVDGNVAMPASADESGQVFEGLTPDFILDALDSVAYRADGRMLALNSYENRVYLIYGEDCDDVVVKFYRPARWSDAQILEEHDFAAQLLAAEIPMVAPTVIDGKTLHHYQNMRFALYRRAGGRAPELDDPDVLAWIGRFIGRIHRLGASSRFQHRPDINVQNYAIDSRDYLLAHHFVPAELLAAWRAVADQCIDAASAAFERCRDVQFIRVHGDCHMGNILWTHEGPHFVDLDDARHAPAVQDLWMMLSGSRADMTMQMSEIIEGYEDFADFDRRELALIEPLRTLRLIHYSAWVARRWHDPAFKIAFPWFDSNRYWEDRILELREQLGLMSEPAIVV